MTAQRAPHATLAGGWRATAACLDEDPELFFPDGETGTSARNQLELARRICAGCDVRLQCLEAALSSQASYGMWGGTTAEERRSMRRRGVTTWEEPPAPRPVFTPVAKVEEPIPETTSPYVVAVHSAPIPPAGGGESWESAFSSLREWAGSR